MREREREGVAARVLVERERERKTLERDGWCCRARFVVSLYFRN